MGVLDLPDVDVHRRAEGGVSRGMLVRNDGRIATQQFSSITTHHLAGPAGKTG